MIDINNSQEFDAATFAEELAEEQRKLSNSLASARLLAGNLNSTLLGGVITQPRYQVGMLSGYSEVLARAKRELTDPIEFLKKNYPGRRLWRFVLTHPDLDHMRGIKRLYENIGFDNFWDTKHTKPTPTYRGDADREDWEFYQSLRAGAMQVHYYTRGDSLFAFGKEQDGRPGGDNIEILSPTPEIIGACNTAGKSNDLSIVLRVHHAGRTILLPGDAEELAWDSMRDFYGPRLKCDFLKASHHGRDSGYHHGALKLVAPLMTIISVGSKPDTDATNKYRQQTGNRAPSTRYHGNIEIRIHDDGSWKWFVDHNPG
jgi:competence protein ComEC